MDKNLPIEERVKDLLPLMTMEEKILQLASFYPNGVERLGIPNLQPGECLHGVAAEEATSFPQAIALGSTWDTDLIEEVATVIAREARALGIHHCYTPMLGVTRDCRWGRTEESYGEDAYLVAKIGEAFINGLQGKGDERFSKDRIIATAKHYVADAEPLSGNNGAAVEISDRALHEVHLPPFKVAVEQAKVGSIMPAHHSLNGVPCHANNYILKDVLRKDYGFDGVIVSDNGDIRMLHTTMKIAKDLNDAAVMALEAGVDSELAWMCPMGENRGYGTLFAEACKKGDIDMALVDEAVANVLTAKFRIGLFDEEGSTAVQEDFLDMQGVFNSDEHIHYADTKRSFGIKRDNYKEILYSEAHNKVALEAAHKSIILLKNDANLLPLDPSKLNRIAVLGPNANTKILGGYSTSKPRYFVTILDGIKEYVGDDTEIVHAEGCTPTDFIEQDIDKAVDLAKASDVVVLAVGGNELTCKENEDVDTLDLVGDQQQLIEAVYKTGTPVVLILLHGRPNSIGWAADNIPAILEGWYLGQECGHAIASTIFGDHNPGGKLPITVPRNVGQVPAFYNKLPFGRQQKYYKSSPEPLYPFGYGLSYTTFAMSEPKLSAKTMKQGETLTVSVDVTNTGKMTGEEVVQLYLHDDLCSVTRPSKELKGFKRVKVEPGKSIQVTFEINEEMLSFRNQGKWMVEPGQFTVMVGNSSTHYKETSFILEA